MGSYLRLASLSSGNLEGSSAEKHLQCSIHLLLELVNHRLAPPVRLGWLVSIHNLANNTRITNVLLF